jgi:Holliday junction DNA helicase RuvA
MIAWLEGVLRERTPTRIIVDVGGVGYELLIPLSTFEQLPDAGKTVALHVYTNVGESVLQLFGFASAAEREVFELLLKANRVGPKLAQIILSGLSPDRLVVALRDGDVKALRGVPGVGLKMAERMVVELRERAGELSAAIGRSLPGVGAVPVDAEEAVREQVLSALVNLGYPRQQAGRSVDSAAADCAGEASVEELLRVALRGLAR